VAEAVEVGVFRGELGRRSWDGGAAPLLQFVLGFPRVGGAGELGRCRSAARTDVLFDLHETAVDEVTADPPAVVIRNSPEPRRPDQRSAAGRIPI